jgi:hypothetical protein
VKCACLQRDLFYAYILFFYATRAPHRTISERLFSMYNYLHFKLIYIERFINYLQSLPFIICSLYKHYLQYRLPKIKISFHFRKRPFFVYYLFTNKTVFKRDQTKAFAISH